MAEHYTDEHQVKRGSSVDYIERCAAFMRIAGDFEGVLDYADSDENGDYQQLLRELCDRAMVIIASETKTYRT